MKAPFWSRTKVGIAAGLVGLVLGVGLAGGESPEPAQASDPPAASVDDVVEKEVARVTDEFEQQLAQREEETAQVVTEVQQAAAADLRKATRRAKKAQKQAVQQAVARERERQEKATPPVRGFAEPVPEAQGSTDPRFSACYKAIAAGYGPYRRGVDAEYHWYDDRDGDGTVCE